MMKHNIGTFSRRLKDSNRSYEKRLKNLRLESLEGRRLLAADTAYPVPFPYQNDLIHEDVSGDYNVSPLDALIVINAINEGQNGALPDVEPGRKADGPMLDVNGDNHVSAIDALMVANFLNGEGETSPTAVFSYAFVDSSGQPLSSNQVAVGDIFQLQTFIQDTRGFSAAGINAAYLDIAFDNNTSFDVAVGEIQSFKFFVNDLDTNNTASTFTFSLDGQTTDPIALFSGGFPRSDSDIADSIQSALEALPNVGAGNVTAVVDQVAKSEDQQNGVPRFNFEIRFGNELAGQDLPLLTIDDSNVAVNNPPWDVTIAEVLAGDQSTPAAEAQAFIFADLYDFARRAEVTATEFNDVGAASQQIPLPTPAGAKLLFTIPMVAVSPGVINFTPNEADDPPSTDIVTGVTEIPTSMVDFGEAFSITVVADPTAPIAIDDSISINEDSSITFNGNITSNDTVTAPRTLSIQSMSTTASTVGTLNGFTYTPPADFVGTDVVTYVAEDSTGLTSNTATVTITVTEVNDAPTANDDTFDVDEDSSGNSLDVLANDSAGPGETTDTLTVTAVGATSNGGTVSIAAGGGSLIYTPVVGFIGTDTFTYEVTDGGGLTDTASVTVTVEPAVLPRARTDSATTDENVAVDIDVLDNDRVNENSSGILISVASGTFGSAVINDGGTPGDATDDTITYTPNDPDFNGVDSFTYVMNDTSGLGADSTGTVTVTVNDINDAPVLGDDSVSGTEDTVTTIAVSTLLANDSPGPGEDANSQNPQSLTVTGVTALSAGGTVTLNGSEIVYTPSQDFNGDFLFSYTAEDNGSPVLSSTGTVTISVAPVNDAPTAGDDTAATDEDNAVSIPISSLLSNDSVGPADEQANQTLSLTDVSASSSEGGTVAISNDDVVYTPAADFFGSDTFTYTISDGDLTATGTVTVTVAPINDAPIAMDDTASGFNEQDIIISVADLLANDSPGPANEASQTLSIVGVSSTADTNGSVVLNNDGTITYSPDSSFTGVATFEYTLQDSGSGVAPNQNQDTGTVSVSVSDFAPTTVSGVVWVDETNDGIVDADERLLEGVKVTLNGTALGNAVPTQTVMTLANGTYSFENLAPGTYTISYSTPQLLMDGMDVPGPLGDTDSVENQFTVDIPAPGGDFGGGYNFAVLGVEPGYAKIMDQLASSYYFKDPSLVYNGAHFALGADNSLLWGSKLDGFDAAVFMEAVLTDNGRGLLLSYVDVNGDTFTAVLGRGDFVKTTDASGNQLIRVLGGYTDFTWQQVSRATPPFNAQKYLDSVDEIFAQEGW